MGYSTELSNRLVNLLFKPPVRRDHKVRHDKLDDRSEGVAKITWAVHGVCLKCRCRCMSVGRCPDCGIDYIGQGGTPAQQISLAKDILA